MYLKFDGCIRKKIHSESPKFNTVNKNSNLIFWWLKIIYVNFTQETVRVKVTFVNFFKL